MRFWVDKEQEKKPDSEWKDAYVFSINRKQYSTIFTNITNSWYRMDQMQIPAIYEDLFIIGLSIFALDKRVSRRRFKNCWTRDINVSIPVLEYDKWKDTGLQWEKMLGFLTGDHWHIVFRKSEVIYSYREHANRIHLNVQDCDCVCLFSGGLDSFCGAIRLLEEGGSPCLVGHNEYPKLAKRQNLFVRTFQDLYPEQSVKFISFTANSRAPISEKEGILKGSENTSRGRSLLFLCAALSVRVCAEKDKLMSVHLRRAEEEAISILKKYRPRRCIIHWFNGNGEQLQQLVDIGCYFSLNSNMVTNEKNKEKLYLIPKTRVLIESDGPFTKIDGKKYTFNNLIKIYELVARYYNEPDIIKMVYANFRDILSK